MKKIEVFILSNQPETFVGILDINDSHEGFLHFYQERRDGSSILIDGSFAHDEQKDILAAMAMKYCRTNGIQLKLH